MIPSVGIAATVKPSAELQKPPSGYYRVLIRKVEDKMQTLAVRDDKGNEIGKREAAKLCITTRLDPDLHPNVDGSIPAYATEWLYPDKDDSWTNGILLAIYLGAFPQYDEATIRKNWNNIDPAKHLLPVNGKELGFFVKWAVEARTYTDKNGQEKKADLLTVITPQAFKEAMIEVAKNTAAAGGAGNNATGFNPAGGGNADPFAGGAAGGGQAAGGAAGGFNPAAGGGQSATGGGFNPTAGGAGGGFNPTAGGAGGGAVSDPFAAMVAN